MPRRLFHIVAVLLLLWGAAPVRAGEVSFLRDVAPILTRRCTGCHGPTKVEGELRLHTFERLLGAGASEAAAVVPGKPEESELYRRLIDSDDSTRMPQQDDPLTAAEIELVKRWIAAGAAFDGADRQGSIKSQMPPRVHPSAPETYRLAVPIHAVAFSPDGKELAVGGHNEVTIWNPADGTLVRRLRKLPQRITSLAYMADGARLLVGGGSPGDYGELCEIDPRGEAPPRGFGTFDDLVLAVAINRAGTQVVVTSADRSVCSYSLPEGKPRWRSQLHSDFVTSAGFSHDDRFVATGSQDFTAKVLEADTGNLFTTYNGHQRQFGEEPGRFGIFALAFASDRPLVFSAGAGRSIRVWEPDKARSENGSAADMEERFSKSGHTRYLYHEAKHSVFKLATSGNHLFAATGDGLVKQYDIDQHKHVRDFSGHRDWVFALDYHAPSARLASGSYDGEVRVWDVTTGKAVAAFLASPGLSAR